MSRAIALACATVVLGVPPAAGAAESDDLLTGYSLTSWHDDAGRALGAVYSIVQDADGYLWLAADAGLLQFDGSRFTPWDRFTGAGIPRAGARSLWLAPDGSLWVGFAQREGVARIDNGQVTRFRDGLNAIDGVTDLVGDARGRLWAVGDRTLYQLDGDTWRKVHLPWTTIEGPVYQPYVTRDGALWVATRWGVFRRAADGHPFEVVSDDLVWGLGEDADGRVWTTDIAIGFRQLGAPPPRHDLQGGGYRLIHDRHGQMWLSTFGDGLWRVTREEGGVVVRRAVTRTGLSSNSVQAVFEDRDGNLWVGTTSGLHRLTRRQLTSIDDIGAVLVTAPARGGGLWVGTASGLLRRGLSPSDGSIERVGNSAPDIRNVHTDADGVLWMGTGNGLWTFDGRQLVKIRIPGQPELLVRWLVPGRQGDFWLGNGDWLYRWDGARLHPFEPNGAFEGGTRIRFAGGDRSGRTWLGLTGGQLGFVDERGGYHPIGAREGLPEGTHVSINAVFEDRDGAVWIGGSGVSRYADGRVRTLTSANGLPDGRVWAIVDDGPGNLWLTMDQGIVRLDRDEIRRAMSDPRYRMRYQAYDARDGVAGSAVGIINATRASDGSLWFAQGGGLTHVDPGQLTTTSERSAPRARIAAVITNDVRALPAPDASFSPGTRRLEIHYAAPALTAANRVRFRYRLEGVDSAWVDAGTDRTAIYTNLAAGQYRFRVESRVDGGSGSSPETVWPFRIEPLFYETTWFSILAAAGVVLGLWGAWRARLQLVERQFSLALAERARLSREIHDTLLQSLVGVALQVDAVAANLDGASTPARHQLLRIRRQVEQYIRDARQSILDLRSPQLENRDLAAALKEFGRTAVADTGTRFVLDASRTAAGYPPRVEKQLLRIGQEAITNAVRHAGASRIRVDLGGDARTVVLSVSDDGRGFQYDESLASRSGHYGLRTMRERAEELGGRLRIVSESGRGTTVTAVAPTTVVAREELLAEL